MLRVLTKAFRSCGGLIAFTSDPNFSYLRLVSTDCKEEFFRQKMAGEACSLTRASATSGGCLRNLPLVQRRPQLVPEFRQPPRSHYYKRHLVPAKEKNVIYILTSQNNHNENRKCLDKRKRKIFENFIFHITADFMKTEKKTSKKDPIQL